MRIALVLRGIHYLENYQHPFGYPRYTIDYHDTLPSIQQNLIQPFEAEGHTVDIFILSYHSKYEAELLQTLKPVQSHFTYYEEVPRGRAQEEKVYPLMLDYHIKAIDMVQASDTPYDCTIITRIDLYYYQKITEVGLDFSCINYPFFHMGGPQKTLFGSEDNFVLIPASKFQVFKEACQHLKTNLYDPHRKIWHTTHNVGEYLINNKGETIKYLFGEKGDGAFDYPMYKFGRQIFGGIKEYTVEEILKVPMNSVGERKGVYFRRE